MRWIYFALQSSKQNHGHLCGLNLFLCLHEIYVLSCHYVMDNNVFGNMNYLGTFSQANKE